MQKLAAAVRIGGENKAIQRTPHLVLLDKKYYISDILPLLARLMIIWLSTQKKSGLSDEQTFNYLTRKRVPQTKKDKYSALGK